MNPDEKRETLSLLIIISVLVIGLILTGTATLTGKVTESSKEVKFSKFQGNTTDFRNLDSVNNPVLEIPEKGKITWNKQDIDVRGADFDSYIEISDNLITVDTEKLNKDFNSSATLSFYNLAYEFVPVIFRNGEVCNNCQIVSYENGILTFNVTSFSSYTTGSNSNLTVWDETDPGILYGDQTKYPNETVLFFANYTNRTNGNSINGTGVFCNISFGGVWETMQFNITKLLYQYNRSFTSPSIYYYNVSCNGSALGYGSLNLTDNVTISNNSFPEITFVQNISALPLESTVREVWISFNATDMDGFNDINMSTAKLEITMPGEIQRNSSSCIAETNDTYTREINCSVNMYYYDKDGEWTINASIYDNLGNLAFNDSLNLTYGQLQAVSGNLQGITFGNVELGNSYNASNDPLIINNTGNQNFTTLNITAYDLIGSPDDTTNISASQFYINASLDSLGDQLVNNTMITITNASLPRDINGIENSVNLYLWIIMPSSGLTNQDYIAMNNWIIEVFT